MNNRHQRRKLRSQMSTEDYIAHLERQETYLSSELQKYVKVVQHSERGGHITLVQDNQFGAGEIAVPFSTYEKGRREAFNEGSIASWNAAWSQIEQYLHPLFIAIVEVNFVMGNIYGVASSSYGENRKRQIGDLATNLGQKIAALDQSHRAAKVGMDVADMVDLTPAQACYQAATGYVTGEVSDSTLLDMARQFDAVKAEHIDLWFKNRPGAPRRETIVTTWICERIAEVETEHQGFTAGQTGNHIKAQLMEKRREDTISMIESQVLESLEHTTDMGRYVRGLRNKKHDLVK